MDNNLPTWVAVLISLLSVLGGGVGVWLLNIYNAKNKQKLEEKKQEGDQGLAKTRQDNEIRMSENEQAFKIYKDIVENLRNDVNRMTLDMNKLEKDHLTCREENAAGKAEMRAMSKEIDYLKVQLGLKNTVGAVGLIEDKLKSSPEISIDSVM